MRRGLSDRQRQVLAGLERGDSYRQIGDDLGISKSTVRTHVEALRKHGVQWSLHRGLSPFARAYSAATDAWLASGMTDARARAAMDAALLGMRLMPPDPQ